MIPNSEPLILSEEPGNLKRFTHNLLLHSDLLLKKPADIPNGTLCCLCENALEIRRCLRRNCIFQALSDPKLRDVQCLVGKESAFKWGRQLASKSCFLFLKQSTSSKEFDLTPQHGKIATAVLCSFDFPLFQNPRTRSEFSATLRKHVWHAANVAQAYQPPFALQASKKRENTVSVHQTQSSGCSAWSNTEISRFNVLMPFNTSVRK